MLLESSEGIFGVSEGYLGVSEGYFGVSGDDLGGSEGVFHGQRGISGSSRGYVRGLRGIWVIWGVIWRSGGILEGPGEDLRVRRVFWDAPRVILRGSERYFGETSGVCQPGRLFGVLEGICGVFGYLWGLRFPQPHLQKAPT